MTPTLALVTTLTLTPEWPGSNSKHIAIPHLSLTLQKMFKKCSCPYFFQTAVRKFELRKISESKLVFATVIFDFQKIAGLEISHELLCSSHSKQCSPRWSVWLQNESASYYKLSVYLLLMPRTVCWSKVQHQTATANIVISCQFTELSVTVGLFLVD